MERGVIKWIDRIVITRDEVSKKPQVTIEGLWTGRDRLIINKALRKQMRKSSNTIIQQHKQADLLAKQEVIPSKIDIMAKARAAKKLKKELEEANKDVRGQEQTK